MRFSVLCSLLLVMFGGCAQQKAYPSKNITVIVPFAAGGGTDSVARVVAKTMEKYLGQTIIIENVTGGSGAVGMTKGSKAKNDGYTVTMVTRELVSLPLLNLASISKDDFEAIGLVNLDPAVLLVNTNSPYQTFAQFMGVVKASPNQIAFASTAKPNFYLGSLESEVGIKFKQIPFNGAGEAIPAVLGGHAVATMVSPGEALAQVQGGQLRPLVVLSDERVEVFPNVPTLKELGYPATTGTWRGLAVPVGTPKEVKDKLAKALEQAMNDPEFVNFMKDRGFGVAYKSPDDFTAFLSADSEALSGVVEYIQANP